MKKKKIIVALFTVALSTMLFVGCGNTNDSGRGDGATTMEENDVGAQQNDENATDGTNDVGSGLNDDSNSTAQAGDDSGAGMKNDTGIQNEDGNNANSNNAGNTGTQGGSSQENGDASKDVVDDVADGVGDAIDNLGGGTFDRYEDAKEYLLGKLKEDNAAANYELRRESQDLTSYNSSDSGAEGYKFTVYETDGNEKIGIYYVDKDTGKIYRYMGKESIEAY